MTTEHVAVLRELQDALSCFLNDQDNAALDAAIAALQAPGKARARTKADQQWGEWQEVLRRLIGGRAEKLHFAADVQADDDGVRFDNCRFIHKEPCGYISFGEYRESCDADEHMRATWQPVWTSKPPAAPPPTVAAEDGSHG